LLSKVQIRVVVTAQLSKKRSRGKKKNHPGEECLAERSALIEILSEIGKYSIAMSLQLAIGNRRMQNKELCTQN